MGNLLPVLQVKTETAVLRQKEKEEKERQAASAELEARCHASAENGFDFIEVKCPIELEETIIEIPTAIRFSRDNKLLVIKVKDAAVTLSWNTSMVNRMKNFWYTLINN